LIAARDPAGGRKLRVGDVDSKIGGDRDVDGLLMDIGPAHKLLNKLVSCHGFQSCHDEMPPRLGASVDAGWATLLRNCQGLIRS
jgi:hypothetical protein